MSTVFKFRVSFEDYDDVIRDIEIKSTQTFEDLHLNIQSSIGFDATKPASFFISNEYWTKGQEISFNDTNDKEGNKNPSMKNAKLSTFIIDPHQKIIYHSDYDSIWYFRIELVKIIPQDEASKKYPICVKTIGEAPKQYKITAIPKNVIAEESELEKLLGGVVGASQVTNVIDSDEDEDEASDNLMEEAEEGVDEDEIADMGEEGEEDSVGDGDDSEVDFADGEEEKEEGY